MQIYQESRIDLNDPSKKRAGRSLLVISGL
jgi:hypothetical protein